MNRIDNSRLPRTGNIGGSLSPPGSLVVIAILRDRKKERVRPRSGMYVSRAARRQWRDDWQARGLGIGSSWADATAHPAFRNSKGSTPTGVVLNARPGSCAEAACTKADLRARNVCTAAGCAW